MLKKWLDDNYFSYSSSDGVFEINGFGKLLPIAENDRVILNDMTLNVSEDDVEIFERLNCDFYSYRFGDNYYYTDSSKKIDGFKILRYVGESIYSASCQHPFLGVHGGYDLLNGSGQYSDWVKKAKFMNVKVLGLCEKNTLAGSMKFQLECSKGGIKPIIGSQYIVKVKDSFHPINTYVCDEVGWCNILKINTEVNVVNGGFIELDKVFEFRKGLIFMIDPKFTGVEFLNDFSKITDYYKVDDSILENDDRDMEYLNNIKGYMKTRFKPVCVLDSYFLNNGEHETREILWSISQKGGLMSRNQSFRVCEDIIMNLAGLFNSDDEWLSFCSESITNLEVVCDSCSFTIPVGRRLLPDYIMTEEEILRYRNKEEMFLSLIQDGIGKKLNGYKNIDIYLDRVQEEWSVIVGNGYVDYFLILWDIIQWAQKNNILVGSGRGSAGGSLIAYLTDIIKINPIEFDLLFERFLNDGRAKVSYPDIDTDFESAKRDEVKRYMEERYGWENVCSVGTYTNLKLKQSFKDISRYYGVSFEDANYISKKFDIEDGGWGDIFVSAINSHQVREFIQTYPDVIEGMRLIINQPKSQSIHACATIITPKGKSVFESFPVRLDRKGGEDIIVSEWEGNELEYAGYLKEDILGVKQLDKYRFIIDLIKKTSGDIVDIYSIPYTDSRVIKYFQNGFNGDIFHFGSRGLTAYCKSMCPENINDLIAAISLFRPGAMDVNSHNEYVLRKHGERDVVYKFMMKSITSETYGLIVYQEQVMKVFQVLADFTLTEADDIRRAIVKKKKELITNQKEFFINKCVSKGCKKEEAEEIWHEVEVHAGYSFNKSHAAAYTVMGWIGQWLKVYYPIQFWTSAFEFDDPDPKKSQVDRYISEINRVNDGVKVVPPDINFASITFTSNFDKKEIYWSISKVRGVGDKVVESILKEREDNGHFFSLSEFLDRCDKRVVNKTVVTNLIFSGCFDSVSDVRKVDDRKYLFNEFYKIRAIKEKDQAELPTHKFEWQMMQKKMCGYGEIDYMYIIRNFTEFSTNDFVSGFDLQSGDYKGKNVVIGGVITEIITRSSKKAGDYAVVELESNHEKIIVTIWNESYGGIKDTLGTTSIMMLEGMCVHDSYRDCYAIHSNHNSVFIFI